MKMECKNPPMASVIYNNNAYTEQTSKLQIMSTACYCSGRIDTALWGQVLNLSAAAQPPFISSVLNHNM